MSRNESSRVDIHAWQGQETQGQETQFYSAIDRAQATAPCSRNPNEMLPDQAGKRTPIYL